MVGPFIWEMISIGHEESSPKCAHAGVKPHNGRLSSQAVTLHEKTVEKDWVHVTTPHDWRTTQVPKSGNRPYPDYPDAWQGFFPTNVGYYRKVFDFRPVKDKEHVTLTFDGIAGFSDVWLNGMWLGCHSTSYLPLVLEVTELLRVDCPNTYNELHVARDGVNVTASVEDDGTAKIRLEIQLDNDGPSNVEGTIHVGVKAIGGPEITNTSASYSIRGCSASTIVLETELENPKLWTLGQGNFQTFGIRSFDVGQDGISINGNPSQKIFGVNLHQDFGVYGGAVPKRIIERKLHLCAEMGANAIRCADHPPAPELLDAADRLGMLVLTETRLLCSSSLMLERLQTLVMQSRSHPSVFAYSMGNEEVYAEGTEVAGRTMQRMVNVCKALNPTRPTIYEGLLKNRDRLHAIPDIQGMHYRCVLGDIDIAVQVYSTKPHILDEEGLFAAARGIYRYDKSKPYSGSFSHFRGSARHGTST
ncbi:glycoside hydrolase superfamily [Aspergillus germanicus]